MNKKFLIFSILLSAYTQISFAGDDEKKIEVHGSVGSYFNYEKSKDNYGETLIRENGLFQTYLSFPKGWELFSEFKQYDESWDGNSGGRFDSTKYELTLNPKYSFKIANNWNTKIELEEILSVKDRISLDEKKSLESNAYVSFNYWKDNFGLLIKFGAGHLKDFENENKSWDSSSNKITFETEPTFKLNDGTYLKLNLYSESVKKLYDDKRKSLELSLEPAISMRLGMAEKNRWASLKLKYKQINGESGISDDDYFEKSFKTTIGYSQPNFGKLNGNAEIEYSKTKSKKNDIEINDKDKIIYKLGVSYGF